METSKNDIYLDAYQDAINLTKKIINQYPICFSKAQKNSVTILKDYLENNGWKCFIDEYTFQDIQNEKNVRMPWDYDPFYTKCQSEKKYNLYAIYDSGKKGKTLILNGHYDIDIIDKINLNRSFKSASIKNGKLYGRGSTDMLSGLCSLATISKLLKNMDWCGKVIFTAVCDEEIGGNGTIRACQFLKNNNLITKNCECVIAEPTTNLICSKTMGFVPFELNINSKVVHMNAQTSLDANEKLRIILNNFSKLKEKYKININIGILSGGIDPSLPIECLKIKGVCAFNSNLKLKEIKNIIKNEINGEPIYFNKLQIDSYENKSTNGILFPSACDAPIFAQHDIPTIILGPGSLQQAHTENEFIQTLQIKQYIVKVFNYAKSILHV